MSTTPQRQIKDYKRTKIIVTYGPKTSSYEKLYQMIEAGANGIRLNFSHGTHEQHAQVIANVKKVSKALGKPVAIIQDLQGPKIRLGDFDGSVKISVGQSLSLRFGADYAREGVLPMQYDLSKKVKRGERLYIFDGKVKTTVTAVKDGIVYLRADTAGEIFARKGINLPDTDFGGDIITQKDNKDIVFGAEQGVDYVALSFVQSADDVVKLKRKLINLGANSRVISKIETRAALDDIEAIVQESDAIMVARGDLATETSPEEVPVTQRKIVHLGVRHAKPVIIATQMLASMTTSAEPTRAEAGDVATAVFIGADAVMLSDETASGDFPLEAIAVMKRIVRYTEQHLLEAPHHVYEPIKSGSMQDSICKAVINLAKDVKALAIVPETKSGATAYKIAAYRPDLPIIAITSSPKVAAQLAIVYGTKSFVRKDNPKQATQFADWLRKSKLLKKGDIIVTASGKHPGVVGTTDTIKVRVVE